VDMTLDEYRRAQGLDPVPAGPEEMTLDEYRRAQGLDPVPAGPEEITAEEYRRRRVAQGEKKDAELLLSQKIIAAGLPVPVREHRFAPPRRWRFDFAWPEQKIAFEVDGGIWLQTDDGYSKGHAHPKRFVEDIEKRNAANVAGWCMLHATPKQVKDGTAIRWLKRAFERVAA
jgi:very-short-patch-repair endonuclease